MHTLDRVNDYINQGKLSPEIGAIAYEFFATYMEAKAKGSGKATKKESILDRYLDDIAEQVASPYTFSPNHKRICSPFDYYAFGVNFVRPLTDITRSSLLGQDNLDQITKQLQAKENVILFGNHQSELDPQILSVLLENDYPKVATEIIFVAGHRVVVDPIAIPFSMGRNLLCIYSKRHIDNPPEERAEKQLHNQRTMKLMSEMLAEGGTCIYVAPSGGRDRKSSDGTIELASFNSAATEMFILMARQAKTTTHFYPLALDSFNLLPPPAVVEEELGERRTVSYTPLHASFGKEIDLEGYPGNDNPNKRARREARGQHIFALMAKEYARIQDLK